MSKIKVGVLGATGMVGQRFIQMLSGHPWFELGALTASERSAGKRYEKAAKWYLYPPMPDEVKDIEVRSTDVESVGDVDVVFSALPSDIAEDIEPKMAEAGHIVASNASSYRMEEDVPLMIPEINPDHLKLLEKQRENRNWNGSIVTNPNCTTIILLLALKPVVDKFGIDKAVVSTMQALSGAGYGGVKAMEIEDNLIPYIPKEEWKTENEPLKILGDYEDGKIEKASIDISASCHRAPVLDGHTEAVFLETQKETTPEEVQKVMSDFRGEPQELDLPTAPDRPIVVTDEPDRPQPRFARNAGSIEGMSVVVGKVYEDNAMENGIKLLISGNNAIRGAAGASLLNAELMKAKKML